MSYKVKTLKLDNLISSDAPEELIPKNRGVTEVAVISIPSGVSVNLRFGQNSDDIPLSNPIGFSPTGEESNGGLYWNNPVAVPGGRVVLLIGMSAPEKVQSGEGSRNIPPFADVGRPPFSH